MVELKRKEKLEKAACKEETGKLDNCKVVSCNQLETVILFLEKREKEKER